MPPFVIRTEELAKLTSGLLKIVGEIPAGQKQSL